MVPSNDLASLEALKLVRVKQEMSFQPTANLEATVLKITGGWEQLKAEISMYRFLEAGHDGDPIKDESLATAMNKLTSGWGMRWPHDRFADKAQRCKLVRHRFAHFLYVSAIVGEEPPDRTLFFAVLGAVGEPFKGAKSPRGMKWKDEEWAQQHRHEESITERELWDTLAELKELIGWCRAARVLGQRLENSPDLPDDHPIDTDGWRIPWRNAEGPQLVLSDLRFADNPSR